MKLGYTLSSEEFEPKELVYYAVGSEQNTFIDLFQTRLKKSLA